MDWFRFYSEVVRDPKVQRLPSSTFKNWVNILCLASDNDPRGCVPSTVDIAFHLRFSEKKSTAALKELVKAGLVDEVDGRYEMHGWKARQFQSDNVTERVRKHRRNVSVTPPDTEAEQIQIRAEPEQTRSNIFVLYDNYMGKPSVTAAMRDVLIQAEEDYPDECITHCFLAAARSSDGRRSWSYVESILKRHQAEGCSERKPVGRNATPTQAPVDALTAIYAAYPSIKQWTDLDPGAGDGGLAPVDGNDDQARLEVRR
mgnify:CR=1 FL=1